MRGRAPDDFVINYFLFKTLPLLLYWRTISQHQNKKLPLTMAFMPQKRYYDSFEDRQLNSSPPRSPVKSTKIILVKGIPYGTQQQELVDVLSAWGKLRRVLPKPSTSHFYLEFEVSPSPPSHPRKCAPPKICASTSKRTK